MLHKKVHVVIDINFAKAIYTHRCFVQNTFSIFDLAQ